ncbi:MAG TPA: ornithine cyclodeaminase family protein [Bryobacteraceae bacterium]|jgi:thiomorpholine-carboxylate dehydrogenase
MTTTAPVVLSAEQVEQLLDLRELIAVMEEALIELSAGKVIQPVRSIMPITEHAGWLGLMPAVYKDMIGTKLVTVFPGNAARDLHTHNATIQLFQAETGVPLAMMDGRVITAWRTAAVSALATRELSSPNSRVLAILGSGVQARTHYKALNMVRHFEEVKVWSRSLEHASQFAAEIGAVATSLEQAVRGADVVTTVTNYMEPFLERAWLKEGAHINAVGAVGMWARELQDNVFENAAVAVESREAAQHESGEIIHSKSSIYAELGELLARVKTKPPSGNTIYKGLGVAVEDVAAARLIYRKSFQ